MRSLRVVRAVLLAFGGLAAFIPLAALASTLADYAGRWAAIADDRNLIVVDIVYDEKKRSASGTLFTPTSVRIAPPLVFEAVKGPAKQLAAQDFRIERDRLHFLAASASNPDQRDAFEITLTAANRAMLTFVGVPFGPLPLVRVDGGATVATNWDESKSYTIDEHFEPNAEMARLFSEDQADRSNAATIDWSVVGKADAARREATRKLLDAGSLHTGVDFQRAAFVFQHGDRPEDYLLAHTLAMIAVAKGSYGALWIGTATLDRYLQSIGQPQIYVTQFRSKDGAPVSQEPFNANVISDALRRELGVPTLAQQEDQKKSFQSKQTKP